MKRGFYIALICAACLMAAPMIAQASAQSKPPADAQKPAANPQQPVPPPAKDANPFPDDTSTVPVLPANANAADPAAAGADNGASPLPGADSDPARSPDDEGASSTGRGPNQGSSQGDGGSSSSSSFAGMDKLLPGAEPDVPKNGKKKEEPHHEDAPEDISVGTYYLTNGNWKGALSRFQSAMVLDPENPDVYWGLAEAERHLGNLAEARTHYERVVEYDPDSRHGKDARKALKEPDLTNAGSPK